MNCPKCQSQNTKTLSTGEVLCQSCLLVSSKEEVDENYKLKGGRTKN